MAISIAYSRKFVPLSGALTGGLAAATGERLALAGAAVAVGVGEAAATV